MAIPVVTVLLLRIADVAVMLIVICCCCYALWLMGRSCVVYCYA
jgi:hypothetical protein